MKKLLILLSILCLLPLSSCHGQRYGILSYQEKEIYAECILNGEYKIAITKKKDERTVAFLEPSGLSSVSFTEKDGVVTARAGEIALPLEPDNLDGVSALLSIFSLSEDCLCYAGTSEHGEVFEFLNKNGEYRLTMNEIGLPKRIQIYSDSFSFDILVDNVNFV